MIKTSLYYTYQVSPTEETFFSEKYPSVIDDGAFLRLSTDEWVLYVKSEFVISIYSAPDKDNNDNV